MAHPHIVQAPRRCHGLPPGSVSRRARPPITRRRGSLSRRQVDPP